ncbi:MAG: tyrosine-type recombinase/integrase [Oscillospiraceae bacterium]|jgi:integrase|nr:tyrosine-type recombinase/integrase [Oscillospiraceae bacterium]
MSATEPIRTRQTVRALERYYLSRGEPRNHALVVMGVYTALRIGDLLKLRWREVYSFNRRRVRESICLFESKTGKQKSVALHKKVVGALSLLISHTAPIHPDAAVFASRVKGRAISRVQAYRIIRAASEELEIERISCHSLRKTFGYHAWKSGVSPAVIMEIYNHSSFNVTRRYLGVTRDDTDAVYLDLEIK